MARDTRELDRFFDTVQTFITAGRHGGTYQVSWGPGFTNPTVKPARSDPTLTVLLIAGGALLLLVLLN